jgi:hypothetical protein
MVHAPFAATSLSDVGHRKFVDALEQSIDTTSATKTKGKVDAGSFRFAITTRNQAAHVPLVFRRAIADHL